MAATRNDVLKLTIDVLVERSDRALVAVCRAHVEAGAALEAITQAQNDVWQILRTLELARVAVEHERSHTPPPRPPRPNVLDRIAGDIETATLLPELV